MIWYHLPFAFSLVLFIMLLLTTALQAVLALEAGDLLRDKLSLRYIRWHYSLLSILFAVLTLEAITALASVEGGIYLVQRGLLRYISLLSPLLYLSALSRPVTIPRQLRPPVAGSFIPLLLLPITGRLPVPLTIFLTVFALIWLMFETVGTFVSFRIYGRSEITRGVMLHVIRSIDHGLCVANRRGWILERNPAFIDMCRVLGIDKAERVDELESELVRLHNLGNLEVSMIEGGKSIRIGEQVYYLQSSSFKARGKFFTQLAFSNVTELIRTASRLEQENRRLAGNNRKLEGLISDIELETAILERERLSRSAHDTWSQRLAVAGLAVDVQLNQGKRRISDKELNEITGILCESAKMELATPAEDFYEVLNELADMYRGLGVKIAIKGWAALTSHQGEVLSAVFPEAMANAVRHAYARRIAVDFFEDCQRSGVKIENDCFDCRPEVVEGRGLYDIKARIKSAGGSVRYKKENTFELKIVFPKYLGGQKGRLGNEGCPD